MASLDTDVNMIPAGEGSSDAGPSNTAPTSAPSQSAKKAKRFEIKKWNAVALWAWDIVVDNCAICRNHIMDLCIECQANQASATSEECTVAWAAIILILGVVFAIMPSISTASADGSRLAKFAPWTIASGSFRSMVTKAIAGINVGGHSHFMKELWTIEDTLIVEYIFKYGKPRILATLLYVCMSLFESFCIRGRFNGYLIFGCFPKLVTPLFPLY